VQAPEGQVTLFAEFEDVWSAGVVLYLVNRSSEGILIAGEDGHPFIRLESRAPDGRWERSERHFYSFCGNTGGGPFLEPDSFLALLGHLADHGEERDVRYRLHGGQELVSNAGRGKVDPAEVLEARYDEMAFREGGMQIREEALFRTDGLPAVLKARARREALQQMVDLPLVEDYPLLDRLFEEMERTDHWDDRVLEVLARHSTRRTYDYVMEALKSGPPARRRYALRNLNNDMLQIPYDRELFELLLEQVKDPKLDGLPGAIGYLGATERDEVKPVLDEIEKNTTYPAAARAEAAYELACRFTPGPLAVMVNIIESDGTSQRPLGAIAVVLTNEGNRPLSFTYRDPQEILRVFLKLDGEHVLPRDSVAWFSRAKVAPAGAQTRRVILAPGERHTLNVNFLDYFDVAAELTSGKAELTVTASARVPGSGPPRAGRDWMTISSGEP
jgi:hypothetical protein